MDKKEYSGKEQFLAELELLKAHVISEEIDGAFLMGFKRSEAETFDIHTASLYLTGKSRYIPRILLGWIKSNGAAFLMGNPADEGLQQ